MLYLERKKQECTRFYISFLNCIFFCRFLHFIHNSIFYLDGHTLARARTHTRRIVFSFSEKRIFSQSRSILSLSKSLVERNFRCGLVPRSWSSSSFALGLCEVHVNDVIHFEWKLVVIVSSTMITIFLMSTYPLMNMEGTRNVSL